MGTSESLIQPDNFGITDSIRLFGSLDAPVDSVIQLVVGIFLLLCRQQASFLESGHCIMQPFFPAYLISIGLDLLSNDSSLTILCTTLILSNICQSGFMGLGFLFSLSPDSVLIGLFNFLDYFQVFGQILLLQLSNTLDEVNFRVFNYLRRIFSKEVTTTPSCGCCPVIGGFLCCGTVSGDSCKFLG